MVCVSHWSGNCSSGAKCQGKNIQTCTVPYYYSQNYFLASVGGKDGVWGLPNNNFVHYR